MTLVMAIVVMREPADGAFATIGDGISPAGGFEPKALTDRSMMGSRSCLMECATWQA